MVKLIWGSSSWLPLSRVSLFVLTNLLREKKNSSKETWNEKKEQESIWYVMCAEEGDSFSDHEPPCTGDNKTKRASILGRMAGPIAFLSCDRYTPHVSQLWTCHLAEAEKMRRGEGMGKRKATRALPPTMLSACLSPCIEIDIGRTSCCLIPANLHCFWRR